LNVNLRDFVDLIRKRWLLIVAATVVCVAVAAAHAFLSRPVYTSEVQLFVSAQNAGAAGDLANVYQGGLFTQQRVRSYVDIATSPSVTEVVVRKLDLPLTPDQVAQRIDARAPNNTVLIDLGVSDHDPAQAQRIARSVGATFISVIDELERPSTGGPSPVKLSVSSPATLPTDPTSPRPALDLALGLLFGLLLGVALASTIERLDTSVRSADSLEARGLVALGDIPMIPSPRNGPVISANGNEQGARVEALRQLRTNLQFVDLTHPPDTIVITSALSAEGKTSTSVTLAATMAQAGLDVVVVEGDLRRPTMGDYLGLTDQERGVTSVLRGEHTVEQAMQSWGSAGRLRVLLAGGTAPNPSELLGSFQMRELLDELRSVSDMVLIDAPPLLPVADAAILAAESDGALLVVRHGRTTGAQLDAAIEALAKVDATILGAVINMAPPSRASYYGYHAT
jgi:capsular exopolysaccharide synthesis family protein